MSLEPALHLVHMLPEPTLLVSGSGVVTVANAAVGELSGIKPESLVGAALTDLVMNSQERVGRYLALCARNRQLVPGALIWRGKHNEPIDVRCDGAVLRPRTETEPSLIFLRCRPKIETTDAFKLLNQKIADLTHEILERKKAEQQRDELLTRERAARQEAERTSQMKDEFLATLSHELRTPLNAILGWAQMLRRQPELAGDAAQGLEVIERNARVQTQLIEDLLDMSRIISGKVRLDVQRVDLAAVVDAAVAAVLPATEAKGVRVQQTLDAHAGPVKGDPNRIQQVVWNLLSNAVKFTPRGGRIHVSLERVNSHLEIIVSDTGEGISPAFLPHVFDRFRQADGSTTRRHGGLGLGLSIVKQLVELHGGTVRAKSPGPGQGSTFSVTLPLMIAHEPNEESRIHPRASPPHGEPQSEVPSLDGLTVLVVEDEPDARALMQRLIEGAGAEVVTAETTAGALDAVRRHRLDVIVSDIGMPDRSGYEFITEVRAMPEDRGGRTPAIALTAFARAEDRMRAIRAGYQLHLAKPVEPAELITMIASLTGRFRPAV